MANELTKTQKLVAYLIHNHNVPVTHMVAMKLAYLIDLISFNRNGVQIFDYHYIRWYWGPFDKKIYDDLNSLSTTNFIIPKQCYPGTDIEYIAYDYNKKKNGILFKNIRKCERAIINEVLNSVRGYGAKMLTQIAYETKPMKRLGATIGGKENLGKVIDLSLA